MHPRQQAAKQGKNTYESKPCKNCGNTRRYTLNASCCSCSIDRSRAAKKARQAEIKALIAKSKGE